MNSINILSMIAVGIVSSIIVGIDIRRSRKWTLYKGIKIYKISGKYQCTISDESFKTINRAKKYIKNKLDSLQM